MNNIGMKKLLKQVGLVLILTAVYLVVAVPFKVMSVIPGFADIRYLFWDTGLYRLCDR